MPGAGLTTAAISEPSARGSANGTQYALGTGAGPGVLSGGWPAITNGGQKSVDMIFPGGGGESGTAGGSQLLPHEVAERSGILRLYLSVIQHLSSNGLAGVLSSPTNGPHLDGVLRFVLGGISGPEDAATKKTCLYIFSLLLGGFNRGRSGGSDADSGGGGAARTAGVPEGAGTVAQRRAPAGKGGGLWQGTGATVDMEPAVRAAVTAFALEEVVPVALRCLVDEAPAGLNLRDATALSAVVHMGGLLKEARTASGGSAGFVGAAALACNCTPQVGSTNHWPGIAQERWLR